MDRQINHDEWIFAYLDGELSAELMPAFEAWVRSSSQNANRVAELSLVCYGISEEIQRDEMSGVWQELSKLEPDEASLELVDMSDWAEWRQSKKGRSRQQDASDRTVPHVIVIPKSVVWLSTAALLLLGIWVASAIFDRDSGISSPPVVDAPVELPVESKPLGPIVATISGTFNAEWGPVGGAALSQADRAPLNLSIGTPLREGRRLNLKAGLAQIKTSRGAEVVLEGPCEIELIGEQRILLEQGRIVGRCPTRLSQGFIVDTRSAQIVDLGTEFGVIATQDGLTEVHVISGKVSLAPQIEQGSDSPVELMAGQGGVVATNSTRVVEIDSNPFEFVRSLEQASQDVMYAYVGSVKSRKPVVYYRFESLVDDLLINEMDGKRYAARVHGSVVTEDIGPGQAASFSSKYAGHIRLDETIEELKGAEAYTVECWVKPSQDHKDYGALVSMTTPDKETLAASGLVLHGLSERTGAERGRLRFYHRNPPTSEIGTEVYSPSHKHWVAEQWMHIAAVKDRSSAKLYINGELVHLLDDTTTFTDKDFLTKIGQHQYRQGASQTRPYDGLIDELAIYDHALTSNDIKKHYQLMRDLLNGGSP